MNNKNKKSRYKVLNENMLTWSLSWINAAGK